MRPFLLVVAILFGAVLLVTAFDIGNDSDVARCAAKGGTLGWFCLDKNGREIP